MVITAAAAAWLCHIESYTPLLIVSFPFSLAFPFTKLNRYTKWKWLKYTHAYIGTHWYANGSITCYENKLNGRFYLCAEQKVSIILRIAIEYHHKTGSAYCITVHSEHIAKSRVSTRQNEIDAVHLRYNLWSIELETEWISNKMNNDNNNYSWVDQQKQVEAGQSDILR